MQLRQLIAAICLITWGALHSSRRRHNHGDSKITAVVLPVVVVVVLQE
jgi:hypothetical protein